MKKLISVLALSVAAATAMPTMAANPVQNELKGAIEQSSQVAKRVGEIQKELSEIRQKAFKDNPDLVKAADAANSALEIEAKDVGYDPKGFEAKLRTARSELSKEGLTEEQRQSILGELKKQQNDQAEKRAKFLAKPQVQKVNADLQKQILGAMKKTSPDTQKLLNELDTLLKSMKS
ncbi:hypothetical protein ACQEXU_20295 [Vibrio sp. TRT 21S02]|uniref:hypothetical protein n=1 Tax=unclassified Vibrio TaxID=2614977 RepID=UPI00349FAB86